MSKTNHKTTEKTKLTKNVVSFPEDFSLCFGTALCTQAHSALGYQQRMASLLPGFARSASSRGSCRSSCASAAVGE
jgi:hypothetical protein